MLSGLYFMLTLAGGAFKLMADKIVTCSLVQHRNVSVESQNKLSKFDKLDHKI